jgi:uncharacterized membrane protein
MVPFGGLIGVILLAFVTIWLYLTTVREPQSQSADRKDLLP